MAKTDDKLKQLPEVLRPVVARWLERFAGEHGACELAPKTEAALIRVIAVSEFAANVILRDWDTVAPQLADFNAAPDPESLRRFTEEIANSEADEDEVKSRLRRFRHRYMLRVLWREIEGHATVAETLEALSMLADRLLEAAMRYAVRQVEARSGRFLDEAGEIVPFVVLGMGKLGGGELNFSSDIDLVYLFPSDGESEGPKVLAGQQYFTRLSQRVVALLDEVTADGFVFRIDTRLRPFGDSGPPVISFAALESYLLQHGRDWERYAYVKARVVGARPGDYVETELFQHLISPFVYRRYLDYGVFESLREMHAMIAAEVKRRELADNIKLGPGGIREIEFIVQSLQLVRGGNQPELQRSSLLEVLPVLWDSRGLGEKAVATLVDAYEFLRRVENFIQAIRDQQTHDLPTNDVDRARLCLAMGFEDWASLVAELDRHRQGVTRQFEAIAFRGADRDRADNLESRYASLWESAADVETWTEALAPMPCAGDLAKILVAFRSAPSTLKIDTPSQERLQRFVPRLVTLAGQREDPVLALERTLSVIERVLRRSAYVALLNENRLAAERLVRLCESSAYVAEQIARFPVFLDELLDPRIYNERISKADLAAELDSRAAHLADADSETQMEALAQFQRVNLFRVAVADFAGNLPIMKVSDSLTFLAETVLDQALRAAWADLTSKHGSPRYELDGEVREAGFGIIAYGKLGGLELSYGSDLDLVFLHDSRGNAQHTDGDKALDNAMFFSRLVRRLVHFLTTQTSSGVMYEIDTRLRPDGRSGLLVTSTDAFERYQVENAWTWEHQALLRARPVAGSESVSRDFERIRAETLMTRVRRDRLHEDVVSMRRRMRKELDRSDEQRFDLKHGHGGIGDIEFIVQFLVLGNAAKYPAVIRYSDNIRQLAALASVGRLDIQTAARLQSVYRAFRRRLHHLSLNDRPPFVGSDEFSTERKFVAAVWQSHLGSVVAGGRGDSV
jgi:glutamate-ammonia-ligase adenylyltransferase